MSTKASARLGLSHGGPERWFRDGHVASCFEDACISDSDPEGTDYPCAPETFGVCRGWAASPQGCGALIAMHECDMAETARRLRHHERWLQRLRGNG
jgi:hypothetical protein